jgi:hypothetical protein
MHSAPQHHTRANILHLQAAEQASVDAAEALATATAKLAAFKASLPKSEVAQITMQLQQQHSSNTAADQGSGNLMLEPDQHEFVQQQQQEEELQLSPEQKRSLADAEAGVAAAGARASATDATMANAGEQCQLDLACRRFQFCKARTALSKHRYVS